MSRASTAASPSPSASIDADPPRRLIALPADVETFKKSIAYRDLRAFILCLNEAVRGHEVAPLDEIAGSLPAPVASLVAWLDQLIALVADVPLEKSQPGRFGNVAFRVWLERARLASAAYLASTAVAPEFVAELAAYVAESFGNKTRIDYGTGHELNFVAFLCCLSKLGLLRAEDARLIALCVFNKYLALMRRVQMHFTLEPAGSRGVWGLDDFQFLPYLWGSAQLIDSDIAPAAIAAPATVDRYQHAFLYFGAIKFILTSKRGVFAEHSPLLHDISGVGEWRKVNTGLVKMYHAEVLHKFVVVQHFLFGRLLPFDAAEAAPATLGAGASAGAGAGGAAAAVAAVVAAAPPMASSESKR